MVSIWTWMWARGETMPERFDDENGQQAGRGWLAAGLLAMVASAPAAALDSSGYFRLGGGATGDGDDMVCFKAPGARAKYRLGNECETYGEVALAQKLDVPGEAGYVALNGRLGIASPGQNDFKRINLSAREHFVEFGGFLDRAWGGALEGTKLWAGKRFYQRHDIYINDYYYWDNSGSGGGFEDLPLGPGRFSYMLRPHVMEDPDERYTVRLLKEQQEQLARAVDAPSAKNPPGPERDGRLSSHDLRWGNLPVNPGGTLTLGLEYRDAHRTAGSDGWMYTIFHEQEGLLGGFNRLALQYGQGPGASLYMTAHYGADHQTQTARLSDVLLADPAGPWSGMLALILEHRSGDTGGDPISEWLSCGVRPQYAFTDHIALAVEYGHDTVNPKSGGMRHLDKITIAPQWTAKPGFLDRPVVRLYMTWANWSKAADSNSLMADNHPFAGTHGMIFGVQYETWW